MEAADVDNDVYRGYDAEGRLLRIGTRGEQVFIVPAETQPLHASELETLLRAFLQAAGQQAASDQGRGLPGLIEARSRIAMVRYGSSGRMARKLWRWLRRR
jgi:hypothetical protein